MSSKDALWTEWILKYSEDRCLRAGALVRGGNGLLTVALKGSNSPSHDRAQGGILLVSPKFLPLPALWEKMEDWDDVYVEHPLSGETVAVFSRHTLRGMQGNNAIRIKPEFWKRAKRLDLLNDEVLALSCETTSLLEEQDDWFEDQKTLERMAIVQLSTLGDLSHRVPPPLWYVKSIPSPLGAAARLTFPSQQLGPQHPSESSGYTRADLGVVIVTTQRYKSVLELLKSIRTILGWVVEVTVVVQRSPSARWSRLGRRFEANCLFVGEDFGLSASRNLGVARQTRRLVFLMDDDFQLDDRCRIDAALEILTRNPEIAILGGNLLDVLSWKDPRRLESSQGFAMRLDSEPPDLRWLRLEHLPRVRHFANLSDYFEYCDIVDNFAIMVRTRVFEGGAYWSPELKIGAEHQDFYLRLRDLRIGKVARTNALKVRNVRAQDRNYRKMRNRVNQFFEDFFRIWKLQSMEITGERIRIRQTDSRYSYMERPGFEPNRVS